MAKKTAKPDNSERETIIPKETILKLVRRKQLLDREITKLMKEYGVSLNYIKGLLKEPLKHT
jgi:hypothetical protein